MRSVGEQMVVSVKDGFKFIGVSIVACCAVFVCNMFLHFQLDITQVKDLIMEPQVRLFYDAQVLMGRVICAISGGCLTLTAVIMLFFYIKHYIDRHQKELGVVKAMGYSRFQAAKGFGVFGLNIFLGAGAGFLLSYLLLPTFYHVMNEEQILPEIVPRFHISLLLLLVVVPTLLFGLLAVLYGCMRLKRPTLALLRGEVKEVRSRREKGRESQKEVPFLTELRRSTVHSRPILVFFVGFSAFCYADMIQMAFSMDGLSSPLFTAVMIGGIGVVLTLVTLLMALTTVVDANAKTISMMKAFGYTVKEGGSALLSGYRPASYIGFAIGTVYQYALLKLMVQMYADAEQAIPEYSFHVPLCIITFITFVVAYEGIIAIYTRKIGKVSVKEIMLEE